MPRHRYPSRVRARPPSHTPSTPICPQCHNPLSQAPWWRFFFTYPNLRLTIPTLLAWLSSMLLHYSFTLRILEFAASVDPLSPFRPPLKDVLHELLPNLREFRALPEAGHLVVVLHLSAQMLYYFDQRSLDAIRTFLWVHGTLMVMRGLCFSSTLIPDSSQQCVTSKYLGSCHDLIFSGHVLIMFLSLLVARLFFPHTHPWHWALLGLVALLTLFFIAAARNHYTVDIVLALLLTPLTLHFWVTHPPALALSVLNPGVYPWGRGGGGRGEGEEEVEEDEGGKGGEGREDFSPTNSSKSSVSATSTSASTSASSSSLSPYLGSRQRKDVNFTLCTGGSLPPWRAAWLGSSRCTGR